MQASLFIETKRFLKQKRLPQYIQGRIVGTDASPLLRQAARVFGFSYKAAVKSFAVNAYPVVLQSHNPSYKTAPYAFEETRTAVIEVHRGPNAKEEDQR